MRSISAWAIVVTVVVSGSLATPEASTAQTDARGELRLDVWTFATGAAASERAAALNAADRLLSAAGVAIDWRDCNPAGTCLRESGAQPDVTLILTPTARPTCGTTLRDAARRDVTVVVSITCVAEAGERVRRLHGRAQPHLQLLRAEDLLGLVVAHEIGHVLGLRHTDRGVMKARLDLAELVGLGRGELRFTMRERADLRRSLVATKAAAPPALASRP